jgi:hypothetical protein
MTRYRPRFWYRGRWLALVRDHRTAGKQFAYLGDRYDRVFLGFYRVTVYAECTL